MTPDEIDAIMKRLDAVETRCGRAERLLFILLGVALGSGAIQLWQVVG